MNILATSIHGIHSGRYRGSGADEILQPALPRRAGVLIEVNLLATELKKHKVLKLPRCPVCSTLNRRASFHPDKEVLL